MTKEEKIVKITLAIKRWTAERNYFAKAIMCADSPEQLEQIINDPKWVARRKRVGEQFNKAIQEVL